MATDDYSMLVS